MRLYLFGALLLALAMASVPAEAGFFKKMFAIAKRDFRRNNMWPEPFVRADRERTKAPIATMIANGWRLQNTLADHHFDADTNELNAAGRLRLETILTERPVDHRMVFVLQGKNATKTAARIGSVHEASADYLPSGELAEVAATSVRPAEWPAVEIDKTYRSYQEAKPKPQLPTRAGVSSSTSN